MSHILLYELRRNKIADHQFEHTLRTLSMGVHHLRERLNDPYLSSIRYLVNLEQQNKYAFGKTCKDPKRFMIDLEAAVATSIADMMARRAPVRKKLQAWIYGITGTSSGSVPSPAPASGQTQYSRPQSGSSCTPPPVCAPQSQNPSSAVSES